VANLASGRSRYGGTGPGVPLTRGCQLVAGAGFSDGAIGADEVGGWWLLAGGGAPPGFPAMGIGRCTGLSTRARWDGGFFLAGLATTGCGRGRGFFLTRGAWVFLPVLCAECVRFPALPFVPCANAVVDASDTTIAETSAQPLMLRDQVILRPPVKPYYVLTSCAIPRGICLNAARVRFSQRTNTRSPYPMRPANTQLPPAG